MTESTDRTTAEPAKESPAKRTATRRTGGRQAAAKSAPARATPRKATATARTGERAKPRPDTEKPAGGPSGLTIRMPFLTVTLGPQPLPPVAANAAAGAGRTVERLAFYGGVAALGVLGVLDWPVAATVAAGTWVAQHTLPRSRAAGGADGAPVVGTGNVVTGTPEAAAPDTLPPAPPAPGS